jgi:uncharacterized protein YegL
MKDYTEIVFILDRSGSMASIKKDIEGGLRTLVADNKKLDKPANFTLVQFDTEYEEVIKAKDIKLVNENEIQLHPRGGTALLDSIGKTINGLGERLRNLPEKDRPNKVVIGILTDGAENSSKEFSRAQIKEMINRQEKDYNWEFIYLGANQDSFTEGNSFGIDLSKIMNYSTDSKSITSAFTSVSNNLTSYRLNTKRSMNYEDTDYKNQVDLGVKQN